MTVNVSRATLAQPSSAAVFPEAFRPWRAELAREGVPPVIAVAGSRGKSTVVHMLGSMFAQAGLVWASKTRAGVSVRGVLQSDRDAWTRIQRGLRDNVIDIAIEEVDWADLSNLAPLDARYAIAAVTNVCANREACLLKAESKMAVALLPRLFAAVPKSGALILNCDDLAVLEQDLDQEHTTVFVGQNIESPVLQIHLESGGIGAWRAGGEHDALHCGVLGRSLAFGDANDFAFALNGAASFQIANALTAIAAAASCGLPPSAIRRGLEKYSNGPSRPHDAFYVTESAEGARVVVDRANPSWHLRQIVRALRDVKASRIITVVGSMAAVESDDLIEVGRLLGRQSAVLVAHSLGAADERIGLLRHGIAQNPAPPVIVHTVSEQRAVALALERARREDLVFVIAGNPGAVAEAIHSWRLQPGLKSSEAVLAAML